MNVVVLCNDVATETDNPAAMDVLFQCQAVCDALVRLGHNPTVVTCDLNLARLQQAMSRFKPDVVVNLVESLGGSDRMMALATLLLEALNLPKTGSGTEAILLSGDKLRSKHTMVAAGIPTPAWFDPNIESWTADGKPVTPPNAFIVKAIHEHASYGLADSSVIQWQSLAHVLLQLDEWQEQTRRTPMAEEFIAGREFNLSILERGGGVCVLPPAEIDFGEFPAAKPRIVGARAKWDVESIEYQLTPRIFSFRKSDQPLLARLSDLAIQCWQRFELSGYARVDFRVNESGEPFVLEVNANPCLSPDAGFAAALAEAGISFDEAIQYLLNRATKSKLGIAVCS